MAMQVPGLPPVEPPMIADDNERLGRYWLRMIAAAARAGKRVHSHRAQLIDCCSSLVDLACVLWSILYRQQRPLLWAHRTGRGSRAAVQPDW